MKQEISAKKHFLALLGPKIGQLKPQKQVQTRNSWCIVRHHYNQSKYALSEEADEPKSKYQPKPLFLAHSSPKMGQWEPQKFRTDEKISINSLTSLQSIEICNIRRIKWTKLKILAKNPFSGQIWAQFGPKWAKMSPKNFEQTKNSQLKVKHPWNQ